MATTDEAAPRDVTTAHRDAQLGMIMARNFGQVAVWRGFMPKCQALAGPLVDHRTAPEAGDVAVVIAGDPDPVQSGGHGGKLFRRFRFQPGLATAIMIIVTQAEYGGCARCGHQFRQFLQRGPAIIGRQHLPLPCIEAGLFQMQVRHQQRIFHRPVKRRRSGDLEAMTGEQKGNHDAAMR